MLMPDRQFNSNSSRYGFNGMEKDDELSGSGNSYDFGARLYNPRLGRWLARDPKSAKYTAWSPYHYGYNSPVLVIDPNGEENIVVTSQETDKSNEEGKKRFKYNFVEPAIKMLTDYQAENMGEKTTWIVMNKGYSEEDLTNFQATADDLGVELLLIENKKQLTNYLNSQSISESKISDNRQADKISDLSIYGHGGKYGDIWLDYDKKGQAGYVKADVKQLDQKAFDNANIRIYSCNSATPNSNGNSLASTFARQTKSKAVGYEGKSSYEGINVPNSILDYPQKYLNRLSREEVGYSQNGSLNQPVPGYVGSGEVYEYDTDGNKIPAKVITFDERENKTNRSNSSSQSQSSDKINSNNRICFVGETELWTERGLIPIKDVQVNDLVYSYDFELDTVELQRVIYKDANKSDSILTIKISSGIEIECTQEHPFNVSGKGWIPANKLKEGDELINESNSSISVRSVLFSNKEDDVYNIQVEKNSNYFITKSSILVHNKSYLPYQYRKEFIINLIGNNR